MRHNRIAKPDYLESRTTCRGRRMGVGEVIYARNLLKLNQMERAGLIRD